MKRVGLILEGALGPGGDDEFLRTHRSHCILPLVEAGRSGLLTWPVYESPSAALGHLLAAEPAESGLSRAMLECLGGGFAPPISGSLFCVSFVLEADRRLKAGPMEIGEREAGLLLNAFREAWREEPLDVFGDTGCGALLARPGDDRIPHPGLHPYGARRDEVVDLHAGRRMDFHRRVYHVSRELFADHPVNRLRIELGENPVTALWLWGGGAVTAPAPAAPPSPALIITDSPMARGWADVLGWPHQPLPRTDGLPAPETLRLGDLMETLRKHDRIIFYLASPDCGGRCGDGRQQPDALRQINEGVIKPLAECLEALRPYRIVLAPVPGLAESEPVAVVSPVTVCGHGVHPDGVVNWTTAGCKDGALGTWQSKEFLKLIED